MDQWMHLMKHLDKIDKLPNYLDKRIFSRIIEIEELAKLTPVEQMSYISSIDRKRYYINTLAYEKKEGQKEGQKHDEAKSYAEKLASARKMLSKGIDEEDICDVLGLSKKEIEKLKYNSVLKYTEPFGMTKRFFCAFVMDKWATAE